MILGKTLQGHRVLKDRSVSLTPSQRAAFILVDGRKTIADILAATRAAGVVRADIDLLLQLELVEEMKFAAAAAQLEAKRNSKSIEDRFAEAYPVATMLTSNLGLRGYRLNTEVEAARSYMDLLALAPRIRQAVGEVRYEMLDRVLHD